MCERLFPIFIRFVEDQYCDKESGQRGQGQALHRGLLQFTVASILEMTFLLCLPAQILGSAPFVILKCHSYILTLYGIYEKLRSELIFFTFFEFPMVEMWGKNVFHFFLRSKAKKIKILFFT